MCAYHIAGGPAISHTRTLDLRVQNTLISGTHPICTIVQPITSLGNNLFSDPSCGSAVSTDIVTDAIDLGPLTTAGNGTQFFPLLPGSAAIDAGQLVTEDGVLSDQLGYPRSFGGARTDIGAVEVIDRAQLKPLWLPVAMR